MIVKRAAVLGRCMGVRRAVDLALATAQNAGAKVYTLGPLIHNPQTVADLEARGILALEAGPEGVFLNPQGEDVDLVGASVVIRAHGVPPTTKAALEAAGAEVVDATCPRVIASQRKARGYAAKGYTVVIAGDRDHGEVTGIAGYAPGALIVGSPEEARALGASGPRALIAQTTIKKEEYLAIKEALAAQGNLVEVFDSICPATADRLKALRALAADCEALVIVGGRNSANTRRLLVTAQDLGLPSWLVEGPAELPGEIGAFKVVGLTAGASTPDEAIDEVEAALLGLGAKP